MKNNKKKALVSAILTIALCFSVIAGATFALFTSKDEVNIAVTSGKVNLTAFIQEETLALSSLGVEQKDKFAVGGTATFDDKSDLTLTNIVPGDKATFEIDVTNNSNVDVMYKLAWKVDNAKLDALVATATVEGETEALTATDWTLWTAPATDAEKTKTIVASIELPAGAGDEYQDKAAKVSFTVEAIQANAVVDSVETEEQLLAALAAGVSEIKLANDLVIPNGVTIENDLTIDLNGKTATATGERAYLFNVTGDADLTIKGGKLVAQSTNGTVDGTGASTGASSSVFFNSTGTLTMTDVEIQGSVRGGHRAVDVYQGNAILTNVDITSYYGNGVNAGTDSTVVLNNCDITVNGMYSAPYNSTCFSVFGGGKMTVNSGNYVLNNDAVYTTGDTHGGWVGIVMSSGGDLIINGGTYTNVPAAGFMPQYERAIFEVENNAPAVSTLYLLGGTFKPQEDQVYGGYGDQYYPTYHANLKDNGDGTWTAQPIENSTFVQNAADISALSAKAFTGNNGTAETWNIYLLSDIDMQGADFSSMIAQRGDTLNIDGNGHKISNVNLVSGENDNSTGQSSLFYAYPNSTLNISDLVIENANSATDNNDSGYGAIVVGYCEGTANITDVDLVNCNVLGAKSSGMIAGHLSGTAKIENCEITNGKVIIREDTVEANGHYAGKIVGTIAGAFDISNVTYDVAVSGKTHEKNVGEMYGRKVSGDVVIDGFAQVAGTEAASAITSGGKVALTSDVTYSSKMENDVEINLNGNTFNATNTLELKNNADLTMKGGDYEVNSTYGHVDVRPDSAEGSVVTFEDVDFSFNKLSPSYGTSTNRLGSVVEVCATVAGAKSTVVFKNCTFNNAMVLIEGMSGKTGIVDVTFENCTFNALTSSAPIYVQNYVEGKLTVKGCTFNLTCTSSTASAISISPSSSTTIELIAENNTINAVAATPYTYNPELGETEVHNVKVNGTPANIKFASYYGNTTATITGTIATGIAAN